MDCRSACEAPYKVSIDSLDTEQAKHVTHYSGWPHIISQPNLIMAFILRDSTEESTSISQCCVFDTGYLQINYQ